MLHILHQLFLALARLFSSLAEACDYSRCEANTDNGGASKAIEVVEPSPVEPSPVEDSALIAEIKNNDAESIKALLADGADVNAIGKDFESALTLVCRAGKVDLVRDLLAAGASPNLRTKESPLGIAIRVNKLDIVEILLQHGAEVNPSPRAWIPIDKRIGKGSYSLYATTVQDVSLLKLLLEHGADVNAEWEGNPPPLTRSAVLGNLEMTKMLLEHGAVVDAQNKYGCTALNLAVCQKHTSIVLLLLDVGADQNVANKKGITALNCASDEAMKCLLNMYATGGRPTWLGRELYKRGLEWDAIVPVSFKMKQEGYISRSDLARAPLSAFTDMYLKEIGITGLGVRCMLLDVRLQSTWLGAALAQKGVNTTHLALCESVIIDRWNRTSESLFASLLPSDLTNASLLRLGIDARHVTESLRELHKEVNEKLQLEKSVAKATEGQSTAAPVVEAADANASTEPLSSSVVSDPASLVPTHLHSGSVLETELPLHDDSRTLADPCADPPQSQQGAKAEPEAAQHNTEAVEEHNDLCDSENSDEERDSGKWEHL